MTTTKTLTAADFPVLSKAKARLLMESPFFATLLLTTPVVITDQIELAATDMKNIYFNPDFLAKLDVADVMAVMVHEVGHNAFLHSERLAGRNHSRWNRAGDHAINLMLEDQGFKSPKGVPGGWLADSKYKGWSAEKIYDDLDDDGDGGGGTRDGLHGDVLPTAGAGDPAHQAETVRKAKQKVAQAATAAKMAGKLSGDLARMVDEFLEPKVPWNERLRHLMTRLFRTGSTWNKRNKRFAHVVLPGKQSRNRLGPIVVIGDSSGSIWASPEELEMMATEIQSVADQVHPESIRLIWADTKVASEEVFERGDTLVFNVQGGGGTDMRVPIAYVEQYRPEVVILLTDGYTPWPAEEPPYPLIVCISTDAPCPIGDVIRLK